jgi:hypothetical protein
LKSGSETLWERSGDGLEDTSGSSTGRSSKTARRRSGPCYRTLWERSQFSSRTFWDPGRRTPRTLWEPYWEHSGIFPRGHSGNAKTAWRTFWVFLGGHSGSARRTLWESRRRFTEAGDEDIGGPEHGFSTFYAQTWRTLGGRLGDLLVFVRAPSGSALGLLGRPIGER